MLAEGVKPELSLASRYPASPYISGRVEGRDEVDTASDGEGGFRAPYRRRFTI